MGSSLFGSGDTRSILVQRSSLLGLVIFLAGSLGIVRGQSVDPATRSSAEQMQTLLPFIAGGTGIVSPPTIDAADDVYHTLMNTPLVVDAAGGVLANDTGTGPLQAELVTDVMSGTLSFNADGSFVYKPTVGFAGQDGFTYRVSDGAAASDVAAVAISVAEGAD
ncbi:MAG: cadherin-like domain-containing protein, partial [Anaerolineales bacterium]|nr:cadherin-like domain-containing protein [Anaerolineales bacterium]